MSDHTTRPKVAVITRYDVPSPQEQTLATTLDQAVRNWICKRPGFVCGAVHTSLDQLHIILYTLWDREDDAIDYMDCPEAKGLWDEILSSGSRLRESDTFWVGNVMSKPNVSDKTD
jgi:hypothetical protein